jgi:hypothetical protein
MLDKFMIKHKKHMMFKDLRYWGELMKEYSDRREFELCSYYEGMISGTIDAMHSMDMITLQTYFNLNHLIAAKKDLL